MIEGASQAPRGLYAARSGRAADDRRPRRSKVDVRLWPAPRLTGRTAAKVGQMVDAKVTGGLTQALSPASNEPAQQPAAAELVEAGFPGLRAAPQSLEDVGQVRRDGRLAVPQHEARGIDQKHKHIAGQRERSCPIR